MTSLRFTAILFILIMSVGWYSLTLYQDSSETPATPHKFPQFRGHNVLQITIRQHNNNENVVFKKTSSSWKMIEPHETDIDQQKIESLLSIFDYGYIDILENELSDMTTYGLDPPTVSVSIIYTKQGAQNKFVLKIGNDNPNETSCYGQTTNDKKLYLLGIIYKEQLLQPSSYYL